MKIRMMVRASLAAAALLMMAHGAFASNPEIKKEPLSIIAILIGLFTGR